MKKDSSIILINTMDDAYSNKPTSARDRKSTIESMRTENMNYIE